MRSPTGWSSLWRLDAKFLVALTVLLLGRVTGAAVPRWVVALPSGLTLELLGVTTGDSIDRAWWKPDGSPLDAPPYRYLGSQSRSQPSERCYELAVRITGLTGERPETSIDRVGKYYVGGPLIPYADEPVPDVFVYVATVPADETAATLEFGVGANEWK